MTFKPGDRVRCIENDHFHLLKLGREYVVEDASPERVLLKDQGQHGFLHSRFELVERAKTYADGLEEGRRQMERVRESVRAKYIDAVYACPEWQEGMKSALAIIEKTIADMACEMST